MPKLWADSFAAEPGAWPAPSSGLQLLPQLVQEAPVRVGDIAYGLGGVLQLVGETPVHERARDQVWLGGAQRVRFEDGAERASRGDRMRPHKLSIRHDHA